MINHFGTNVKEDGYITRENYAKINPRNSIIQGGEPHSEEWCIEHQKKCLENYDINMKRYSELDVNEFNSELNHFLSENPFFKQIYNLDECNEKGGYYIMVLDKYKQLYVGYSQDVKKRILQHWKNSKPFDRLLFPMGDVQHSVLSIDSFKALDTTRIYFFESDYHERIEDIIIKFFSPKFVTNRVPGGLLNSFKVFEGAYVMHH